MEQEVKLKRKLDERYSWEELGEVIANKIIENKLVDPFNKEKFLEWFMKREKLGMRMDWKLLSRAYYIWRDCIRKEKDHFTVIVGCKGDGKSTLGIQFLSLTSHMMGIDDICFNMPQYIKLLTKIFEEYKHNQAKIDSDDSSLLIDEGGINLFSRESLSNSNKTLAKTFMVQRCLNVHVGICIPHYWSLDKLIRSHRINTLILIKERGTYKCIVGKGIKIFNKLGAKDKDQPLNNIPIPYKYFWEGTFRKDFPKTFDRLEYEKHKLNHIGEFLSEIKTETSPLKMHKVSDTARELSLNALTISTMIQKGKIEGRKIGGQWFITPKAYETLTTP